MRVLLVEDNDINLLIAADILEELGVTVDTATDGQQAVERLPPRPRVNIISYSWICVCQ